MTAQTTNDNFGEFLRRLALVTRVLIRQDWNDNSCIATTRVVIEILRYFGITATPLPVSAMVFNQEGWLLANADPSVPVTEWPSTAWSLGIVGTGERVPKTNGWDGHLVAYVYEADSRWIVDASLDQFSRPQRGIELLPSVFGMPKPWTGDPVIFDKADGTVVVYRAMQNPGPWRRAPDWSGHKAAAARAAGAAIRMLRKP